MRRALAIDKHSFGPDHPNVARCLNNLALLLQDTNRRAKAEPLMRRALAIDQHSFGPDHPNVAIRLNNLALLLQDTNRRAEKAEPLLHRALGIVLDFTRRTGYAHLESRHSSRELRKYSEDAGPASEGQRRRTSETTGGIRNPV